MKFLSMTFLRTALFRSAFLAIVLLCLAAAPGHADKRVALVIGNSDYQHIARLDNPKNDAKLIAATLRDLGFTLVGDGAQLDLDKPRFDSAVESFGKAIVGANVALFYYAGHGLQVRGSNYLVPTTANPTREADVDFQMVDVALVLRQMESAGTKLNFLILDACRNNPFPVTGLRATAGGLAQVHAPEGTLVSYATQPGNVSQDGQDGNSPYTKSLAQALRKPGVDVFQTFNEVGLSVKKLTGGAQQPWVSSSPIDGDFYFSGKAAPAPAGTSPASNDAAARAWETIQNTTSPATLEAFIRRFGDNFYSDLARARIVELKAKAESQPQPPKVALVVPPGPPIVQDKPGSDARASCAREAGLKSMPSTNKTSITFLNGYGAPVNVYWLDFTGKRKLYLTLQNGESRDQITFLTHPWVVTDAAGQCLGLYVATPQPQQVDVR